MAQHKDTTSIDTPREIDVSLSAVPYETETGMIIRMRFRAVTTYAVIYTLQVQLM